MRLIFAVVLVLYGSISFAQKDTLTADSLELKVDLDNISNVIDITDTIIMMSDYNRKGALRDIRDKDIKILLPGGFVGTPTTSYDKEFERKYHIRYVSQGCVRFQDDDEEGYNHAIFDYLDSVYGPAWRKEVHKDAIGLYYVAYDELSREVADQSSDDNEIDIKKESSTSWSYTLIISLGIILIGGGILLRIGRKKKNSNDPT